MSAGRAGPTASAMRRRALVCWALLLALGLCRAHRARPRNVLLILGECVPADPPPPRASLFTAACCRPAPAAVSVDPSPEALPVSSHCCPQTLLWRLLAEGGRAVSPTVGTAGWAPPFSTPLLQQALTPTLLHAQCPRANPADRALSKTRVHRSPTESARKGGLVPPSPEASQSALGFSSPPHRFSDPPPQLCGSALLPPTTSLPSSPTPPPPRNPKFLQHRVVQETSRLSDRPDCHKATWLFPLLRFGPVPRSLFLIKFVVSGQPFS